MTPAIAPARRRDVGGDVVDATSNPSRRRAAGRARRRSSSRDGCVPVAVTFWATRRDAALEVGGGAGLLAVRSRRRSTTSACWVDALRNVSTAMIRRAPASARRARSVSGQSASGSAPTAPGSSMLAVGGGASACAVRRDRRRPGRMPSCERADHVAAPERRQHGGAGHGGEHCLQRGDGGGGRLGEVGASGDDHDAARPSCAAIVGVGERLASRRSAARRARSRSYVHAYGVRPGRCVANSMMRLRRFSAASRRRRYSTGSSSFRSGPSSTMVAALAASSMVARGRPRTRGQAVAELRVHVGSRRARRRGGPRRTRPRWCRGRRRATPMLSGPPEPSASVISRQRRAAPCSTRSRLSPVSSAPAARSGARRC